MRMTSPLLMLPCPCTEEIHNMSLYSLEEKSIIFTIPQKKIECVGSSHGWLVFLDEHANPLLVDPFSGTRISLPHSNISKIQKVILSTNPSYAKNYSVVALFGTKIAFCRGGDEEWRDLDRQGKTYYDVVICDETNTAFAVGPGPSLASWDLNQIVPQKKTIINSNCPGLVEKGKKFPADLYSSQWYLALSVGKIIYLVVRYIGEFVRYDGKVVYEGDTLTEDAAEPLVCPYRTVGFYVFKLQDGNQWVEVESLNDLSLFLGGNQSTILSGPNLERDAIYFTDDYWERIDEDYMYGGHDMGIFKLGDATIHPIPIPTQQHKIAPPPFWIIKSS